MMEKIKNNPKVSVIIPTIGRESLIRTLESVLNQTYQNLEIITDDTEEGKAKPLIERYLTDPRIKYVINTKYKLGVGFYLHKALKVYSIDNQDRVTFQCIEKAKRTYLNYVLFLKEFEEDFKNYCPKSFIRLSLIGIYFSALAGEYKQAFKLCIASVKVCPKLFFIPILWTLFCIILPKSFVIQFYEKYSKRFKKVLKQFLFGGRSK